jgi:hypothetical protein
MLLWTILSFAAALIELSRDLLGKLFDERFMRVGHGVD